MPGKKLPSVSFVKGLAIDRLMPSFGAPDKLAPSRSWVIIGLAGPNPFLLTYQQGGATHWQSPMGLGESLRKKILAILREDVRQANPLPPYIVQHDFMHLDFHPANDQILALWQSFFDQEWRIGMLQDDPNDWIAMTVPFAEKDQVKALGGRWDAAKKAWLAPRARQGEFERWLPPVV